MGRLAIGIYDHAFMGMLYVDQAQEEFLRFVASHGHDAAGLSGTAARTDLQKVLDRLNVAMERAATARTRAAGVEVRDLLAALPDAPAAEVGGHIATADRAMTRLVKKFAGDGLDQRDDAGELTASSFHLLLMEVAGAVCLALGIGFLFGRSLSRPLVLLVAAIERLAAGDLSQEIMPRLVRRRDEIGAVARATAIFRTAMQENSHAQEEQQKIRAKGVEDKIAAFRVVADNIEQETLRIASWSEASGTGLVRRAEELSSSAARVLASVGTVTEASQFAMQRCDIVAAAGEKLSTSAEEIAGQIKLTAAEIASTARAGEHARELDWTVSRFGRSDRHDGTADRRDRRAHQPAGVECDD